jgi:hypothetical protein
MGQLDRTWKLILSFSLLPFPFPVLSCVSNQLYRLVVLVLVSSLFCANGLSKIK